MEQNYCCIPIIPINWYLEVAIIVILINSLVLVLCLAHRIFWKNTYLMNFLQYRILQLVSSVTFKISFSNWLILFHLFIFFPLKTNSTKKKWKKKAFYENEAELSGSDVGSDEEELGSEYDEYEIDSDIENLPDEERLKKQLHKIHQ